MLINYITGHAGTGKSTLLIEHLKSLPHSQTLVMAPTHKALKVLVDKLDEEGYEFSTIHSALGWVPGVSETAEHIHHVDITHKLDKDFEGGITNIIIDEFSMMSEDMLYELTGKIDEFTNYDSDHITLTLYGDPFQLPPVKATPIQTDPTTTTYLTEQYRADNNDIPALFTKFVHYIEGSNTSDLSIQESEHVSYVDNFKGFKRGDRALAYTNKTVGELNQQIALQLGFNTYKGSEVQIGNMLETIIMVRYLDPMPTALTELFLEGKLKLQNGQINLKYLDTTMRQLAENKDIVFIEDTLGDTYAVIEGIGNANLIRKNAKEQAVIHPNGSRARSKAWQLYYTINRAYTMDYTFASSVHKSQGSEFDRVWIHKSDILKAIGPTQNYQQYARMMYVALSRAKKQLFIYG